MNQSYEQYDVIIIGSGKSGQTAINAMKEQGTKALLIELEPHTVATMVNQSLIKPQPSSPIHQTAANKDSLTHHIVVHKQIMSTTMSQTVTYTFYASSVPDVDHVVVEADQNNKDSSYLHSSYAQPVHNNKDIIDAEFVEFSLNSSADTQEEDLEVVEPEWIENQDDHESFSAKFNHFNTQQRRNHSQKIWSDKEEGQSETHSDNAIFNNNERDYSLRGKLHRRKHLQANDVETDPSMNFGHFSYNETGPQSQWAQSGQSIAPNKEMKQEQEASTPSFLHTLLDQPLHLERESRLRKRFINKQRIENQQKNVLPSPNEETANEFSYEPPRPQHQKTDTQQNPSSEPNSILEENQSDFLHTDSNFNRKRTRAQKKKRLFGKQETLFETKMKKPRQKPTQTDSHQDSGAVYQFDSSSTSSFTSPNQEDHYAFDSDGMEESPSMDQHFVSTDPSATSPSQQLGGDTLKRDNIEFEEPYGYSSWEEFVTPYSNNRKRQEMDQVEKRKIALRGLHNLINNLG